MAIIYQTIDVKFPNIKRRHTGNWIKLVIAGYSKRVGDIACVFCSDKEILRINNLYLNHDYYTDIITFDYSEENFISGDLFISPETVKSNSEKFGTDYQEELYRVIIHGILHLCGLKDESPEEEKIMRQKENEALSLLV
jgi:rRNA maturation RNase YbeY